MDGAAPPLGLELERPDLTSLFVALRANGYALGVDQCIAAERVAVHARELVAGGTPIELRDWLSPVLCTNEEEQRRFPALFGEWSGASARSRVAAPETTAGDERAPGPAPSLWIVRWPWLASAAGLLALLGGTWLWIASRPTETVVQRPDIRGSVASSMPAITAKPQPMSPAPAASSPPPRATPLAIPPAAIVRGLVIDRLGYPIAGAVIALGGAAAKGSQDLDPTTTTTGRDGRFVLPFAPATAELPIEITWAGNRIELMVGSTSASLLVTMPSRRLVLLEAAPGALAGVPLVLLAAWLGWRAFRRRLALGSGSAPGGGDEIRLPLAVRESRLFRGHGFRRALGALREHRDAPSPDLDVEATVEASARAGGPVDPRRRARPVLPEYLVLIDRASSVDQQARWATELVALLSRDGPVVRSFAFDGAPHVCEPLDSLSPFATLEELTARFGDHRLLVFSDGSRFADAVRGHLGHWIECVASFRERALVTPADAGEWGPREAALARAGLPVLPATAAGLATFVALAGGEVVAGAAGVELLPALPTLLDERPWRWRAGEAPPLAEEEEMLVEIERYLGCDGFRWLAAAAIYPTLEWHVTLLLGTRLRRGDGRPLLSEAALLRLVRLPWFRDGVMPRWLRLRLASTLSPQDEADARAALLDLLATEVVRPDSPFVLELTRGARRSEVRRWCELVRERLRGAREGGGLRDAILLEFIGGLRAARLQLAVSGRLRRRLYDQGLRAFGPRPVVMAIAAAVAAVAGLVAATAAVRGATPRSAVLPPVAAAWTSSSGHRLATLATGAVAIREVAPGLEGHRGFALTEDGRLLAYDAASRRERVVERSRPETDDRITAIARTESGLLVGFEDGRVIALGSKSETAPSTKPLLSGPIDSMSVGDLGRRILVKDASTARVFALRDRGVPTDPVAFEVSLLRGRGSRAMLAAATPLVALFGPGLRVYDGEGRSIATVPDRPTFAVLSDAVSGGFVALDSTRSMRLSPDGDGLRVSESPLDERIGRLREFDEVKAAPDLRVIGGLSGVVVLKDGSMLGQGPGDGQPAVSSTSMLDGAAVLVGRRSPGGFPLDDATTLAFAGSIAPDERTFGGAPLLITGHRDGLLRVWSASRPTCRLDVDVSADDPDRSAAISACVRARATDVIARLGANALASIPWFEAEVAAMLAGEPASDVGGRTRFTTADRIAAALARLVPDLPAIDLALAEADLPDVLRYLPAALDAGAGDTDADAGVWRLPRERARDLGMTVEQDGPDERANVARSASSVAQALRRLERDWPGDDLLVPLFALLYGEEARAAMREALSTDAASCTDCLLPLLERGALPADAHRLVVRLLAAAVMAESGFAPAGWISQASGEDAYRPATGVVTWGAPFGALGGDMVWIPGGQFLMGCNEKVDDECGADEKPGREVRTRPFWIDRTEVTVGAFATCVEAGACAPSEIDPRLYDEADQPDTAEFCNWDKPGRARYPMNCVDWSQANSFCTWAGKRLPTDVEWERAARGTDGRKYPWGSSSYESAGKVANIADQSAKRTYPDWVVAEDYDDGHVGPAPVGSFPAGASPDGLLDMIGNVWEWASDELRGGRGVRGGSWDYPPRFARASYRRRNDLFRSANIGFRCASD